MTPDDLTGAGASFEREVSGRCDLSDAEHVKAGEMLCQTLAELEDVKASLHVSSEKLALALQSACQIAWEIDVGTDNIKIIGDPQSTLGFDLPPKVEERLARVHPEDLSHVIDARAAALAGAAPRDVEIRMVNPITGETIWVHWTGRLVSDHGRAKLVGTLSNITARKKGEERLGLLVGELQHRTRNLISVVSAIADKTLTTSKTLDDFKASFQDRLGALARVQGLLFRLNEDERVTFDELIETELSAQSIRVGKEAPVTLNGPKGVRLRSGTVQTLAMVLHELVTNAVKHGALKGPNGHLTVGWRLETSGESGKPWLHLDWKESGLDVPPFDRSTGQGRELIERALPYQFGAKTTFVLEPNGIHCTISLPVSALTLKPS